MERRKTSYMTPEMRHKLGGAIEHLIGEFTRIKTLSASAEIDNRCVDGISVLMNMADAAGVQAELDELRKRRIDPTM